MKKHNRIARSLCAVMLAVSTLMPPPVARAVDPVAEGSGKDVYSLTVEFGSLAFYYDHGIWDPNLMNYVASTTDGKNAEGTTQGFPGWYGFDDTANKISVTNTSAYGMTIDVSLKYRQLTATEAGGADKVVTGVAMTVENTTGDSVDWTGSENNYSATLANSQSAVALIQLHGEPQMGGKRYVSENQMAPIGMLELKIERWEPTT